jgi:hypothetical protein
MSGVEGIVLQKSPSSHCEIETPDLEPMLRDKMLKILLQHNRGETGH